MSEKTVHDHSPTKGSPVLRVAVLGAGGVGGLMAAALARAGAATTIVARPATARALAQGGLTVRSRALGEFVAHPATAARLTERVDALLVATKAIGLAAALARVRRPPAVVVPLLNGLDHLELLRDRFGADLVAAAVIRVESDRPRTGAIVQTSPSIRIDVAAARPSDTATTALTALVRALRNVGIDVRTGSDERTVMWSKLARLCPLALTTTAFDEPIGTIRSDPGLRDQLHRAVAETAAVAHADGASVVAAGPLGELRAAHPSLRSSMHRDLLAGREPELDAIAGAVLRAGARHGIPCPTVARLAAEIAARAGLEWDPYSGGRIGSAGRSA